jgi:SAM-dependent methyltransferase
MDEKTTHWNHIYREKLAGSVSWYEAGGGISLELIGKHATDSASVLDVGAGASELVDGLLADGRRAITLLDLSASALEITQHRLGAVAKHVKFVVTDLLGWEPDHTYGVWHDRAVFHFLTDPEEQRSYVEIAATTVAVGGLLILGAFAPDGPLECSGLATTRWSATALADAFAGKFSLEESRQELHRTPSGTHQSFTWVVMTRR